MKRITMVLLCLSMLLWLCACGKSNTELKLSENAITIVDVQGLSLPDAISRLKECGATNITTNENEFQGWETEKLVVVAQSVETGNKVEPEQEIHLTCKRICLLYLDIKSEANLIFNTYDIDIYLDKIRVGSVSNGKSITQLMEVLEGDHIIYAYKGGDNSIKATKKITLAEDVTFSSDISHGRSIEFKNYKTLEGVHGFALVMPNVCNMVLSDAESILSECGFINFREEPYGEIWDKNNWIIVQQNIEGGSRIDKNEYIQLDCISLTDYFNKLFSGLNVNEIERIATELNYSVKYRNEKDNDITTEIKKLDENEKEKIIATEARQYTLGERTSVVKVQYQIKAELNQGGNEEGTDKTNQATTPKTSKDRTVSYSTNTLEIAKKGNSGIFSYVNSGKNYDMYYIIDFDEGYVYYFEDGNKSATCDKVKIDSGNLNDYIVFTYHDGDDVWSCALCFKWKNQPDRVVFQNGMGLEVEFSATNLSNAISIRNSRKILEY